MTSNRPKMSAQMLLNAHHFAAYLGGAVVMGAWYERNWWVAIGAAFGSSFAVTNIGRRVLRRGDDALDFRRIAERAVADYDRHRAFSGPDSRA